MVTGLRSPVVPVGGAFQHLSVHELGSPVIQALCQQAGLPLDRVDALVVGNALGAGGNPARLISLAAGLAEHCASYSVDSQCCSGLDAVKLGIALLHSGQAEVVIAGGVEAWSRAPIRMHRPLDATQSPIAYERPAFAPDPERDPDMLLAAARYAHEQQCSRSDQEAYAMLSHQRALAGAAHTQAEMVPILGVQHDVYPRHLRPERVRRMPVVASTDSPAQHTLSKTDCALSTLTVSCKADGAAFVLLATPQACTRYGLTAKAQWLHAVSLGGDSATPMTLAAHAAQHALQHLHMPSAANVQCIELHDAFAVQGLDFCSRLDLPIERINGHGGGLARGHPIGASAGIALVRVLSDLWRNGRSGDVGLAAVAGAGGLGSAALLQRL